MIPCFILILFLQTLENTVIFEIPNVGISDSVEIRTKDSSDFSTFGFWAFGIFGTHSKRSDFSMFGVQTLSEIQTFKRVQLASKWLAESTVDGV